jgi:hypothetical protein
MGPRPIAKLVLLVASAALASTVVPLMVAELTPNACPVRESAPDVAALFPEQSPLVHVGKAYAVSQWTRKYKTSCTTCHTSFPRLNYAGEKFMRNGFQDPDDSLPDGDTKGKKEYGNAFIGKLGDYFGARVSLQPVKYQTKVLTENGGLKSKIDVGEVNWIQFFTAGTVAKNVSFFNELEIDDGGAVKHGWFILGVHNLFSDGLVNFQVGKISPVEWTSFSNRLRIFPELKGFADKLKSSSRTVTTGAAAITIEDQVDISSSQYGINYYGYAGPVIWTLGAGNGRNATDLNQEKNFWGSLRVDITSEESKFEGSSLSMFGYRGVDTATTATAQVKNTFYRYQPSLNIRWNNIIDIIGSFHYGTENNMTLTAAKTSDKYWGITGIVSAWLAEKFQVGAQYDTVKQSKGTNLEDDRVALHVSYLPRENINLIATADTDLFKSGTKNHQFYATVRMMW